MDDSQLTNFFGAAPEGEPAEHAGLSGNVFGDAPDDAVPAAAADEPNEFAPAPAVAPPLEAVSEEQDPPAVSPELERWRLEAEVARQEAEQARWQAQQMQQQMAAIQQQAAMVAMQQAQQRRAALNQHLQNLDPEYADPIRQELAFADQQIQAMQGNLRSVVQQMARPQWIANIAQQKGLSQEEAAQLAAIPDENTMPLVADQIVASRARYSDLSKQVETLRAQLARTQGAQQRLASGADRVGGSAPGSPPKQFSPGSRDHLRAILRGEIAG